MPTVDEALRDARTNIGAALKSGVDTLSHAQEIVFKAYTRLVLPLDGFVFWVINEMVSPGAILNAMLVNGATLNEQPLLVAPPTTFTAQGSLHYASDMKQDEDASFVVNSMVFTSEQPVQHLNAVGPNLIYIAEFDGVQFAFSRRESFYKQANLWHYVGDAVYSMFGTQVVSNRNTFNGSQLVVSNSLPGWLNINSFSPPWPRNFRFPPMTLFPSHLVPQNEKPPYASVHIGGNDTTAMQAVPYFDATLNQSQLAKDRVTVTLYGLNNDAVMEFLAAMMEYFENANVFGLMNDPIVLDDKRTQPELLVLAMKKRIVFEVSYNQGTMRNVARQMIKQAIATVQPQPSQFIIGV